MKAEMRSIKDQNLKLSHKQQNKGPRSGKFNNRYKKKPLQEWNPKTYFQNNLHRKPRAWTGKLQWRSVPPTKGETQKSINGKTYFWCSDHQAWGLHRHSDCEWRKAKAGNKKPTAKVTFVDKENSAPEQVDTRQRQTDLLQSLCSIITDE